ncbi:MAG TPA: ATP-binding protein [Actinomycetota bacterium]|nr:ATP-binding protein [Actinomycetota bacterium]
MMRRYPLRFFVYLVGLIGGVAVTAATGLPHVTDHVVLALFLVLLLAGAEIKDLPVYDEDEEIGVSGGDAIVLAMIVALPIPGVALGAALAMGLARLRDLKKDPIKELFNVAEYGAAAAFAAIVWSGLHDSNAGFTPWNALAAVAAILSFAAATHLFVAVGLWLAGRVPLNDALQLSIPAALFSLGGNVVLGLFFIAAYTAASWTVFLFPVPLAALYVGVRAVVRQRADKKRAYRLLNASHALSSGHSWEESLDRFLHAVARTLSAREVHAVVATKDGSLWSAIHNEASIARLEPAETSPLTALIDAMRGDPVAVAVSEADHESRHLLEPLSARGLIAAPVVEGGRKVGLLAAVDGEGADGFTDEDVALLQALANELSLSLASARLLEEMGEERERFELLVEAVSDYAIYMTDPKGVVVSWNSGAERIFGYTTEEIVGVHLGRFYPREILASEVESTLERARTTGRVALEGLRLRRDGVAFLANEVVWPVLDEAGALRGFATVTRDITDIARGQVEKESLEAQLHQAQRLESVGQLAGGVAHDFNNLLSVILNCANFVLDDIDEDSDIRADIQEMKDAATRGAALTRQLLVFARRDVVERQPLDLNDVINGMSKLLTRALGEPVTFSTRLEDRLDPIVADPGQVEQILMNLALNARDAMPHGGEFLVETSIVDLDESEVRSYLDLGPGRFVRLHVSDTGEGMPDEVLRKAFDPFFTTKAIGEGTGLGLAMVYGIVHGSGGHISVASTPGAGTSFDILFPAGIDKQMQAPAEDLAPPVRSGNGETVLLVEDEESVRSVAARILNANGYEVVDAADGHDAIERLRGDGGRVSVVVTDVAMPGMSGPELAAELAEVRPDVSVVLMSGFSSDVVAATGGDLARYVQKPLIAEDLLAKVSDAINA